MKTEFSAGVKLSHTPKLCLVTSGVGFGDKPCARGGLVGGLADVSETV